MKLLSPNVVKQKISEANTVLVDIRGGDEYSAEHIKGAINITPDNIGKYDYKDKDVIFHCLAGVRTKKFEDILKELPTKNSFIMEGGMDNWKAAGYLTEKKGTV